MKILEHILQEIKSRAQELSENHWGNDERHLVGKGVQCMYIQTEQIIRSHMEDDGWVPIEEGLPPIGKPLIVTIKDNLQGKPNERRYSVYYERNTMKDGYHWSWRYGDFAYELLPDASEVIAWQLLPRPYQPKED